MDDRGHTGAASPELPSRPEGLLFSVLWNQPNSLESTETWLLRRRRVWVMGAVSGQRQDRLGEGGEYA